MHNCIENLFLCHALLIPFSNKLQFVFWVVSKEFQPSTRLQKVRLREERLIDHMEIDTHQVVKVLGCVGLEGKAVEGVSSLDKIGRVE